MNPGDIISRYCIVGRIGRGGMGVVYRAEDTRLRRPVALKFLPPDGLDDRSKSRFLNEARAAALARHPNICPIHDIEEADGELFIVMAFIDGETLSRRISRGGLELGQALDIAAQVAGGLAAAHDLGIVHRDIKSGNIMVDPTGHVSIMDFGLALAPEATRLTGHGASVGTPDYMSPEQAQGREVDRRTDLWSLGVVLYEMLTGSLPFRREHRGALVHAILHDPIPEVTGVNDDVRQIVARALVRDPAGRWTSANAMLNALRRAQGVSAAAQSAEFSATQTIVHSAPPPTRRRRPLAAIVAAAAVLLAAAGFAAYRFRSATPPAAAVFAGKQIAIFPFQADNASAIANGLDEVLTTALSNQPSVIVVPSADLRRRGITTISAARKFYNITLAISGAAEPKGDNVEFTVNLVDAVREQPIETRKLVYDPKNPIVSRDQAVSQVLRMLNLDAPAPVVKAGDSPAPDASSAYLEGRGLLARYDIPGNIDKAIAAFQRATKQDPKFAMAFAGLAEAFWRKSRISGDREAAAFAMQNGEYARQLDASLAITHSVLGSIYRDAGREPDAIREYQRAMELAPGNAEAPRQLAEIYNTAGRFAEAEALYKKSTDSRPTDWYGHLLLGLFYSERDRPDEAIASLNKAKALTPDNDLVRRDIGAVLLLQGRYQESVDEYKEALRTRTTAGTYAALSTAHYFQHHFAESVSAAEAAIDLDANDYRYWGNLGIFCRWVKGYEGRSAPALRRAIELASKVAETRQSDYAIFANLAQYHATLGDRPGALAEIARIPATARGPYAARIATAYELTGNRDQAVAIIRAHMKSRAALNLIKDDPDLEMLWRVAKLN